MAVDNTFQQNLTGAVRSTNAALVGNQGGSPVNITATTTNLDMQLWGWDSNALAPVKLVANASGALTTTGGGGGGAVTIADGADVAQGATTDAAVISDVNGTLSGKLRGLVKILADIWDSVNHRIKVDGSGVTQPVSGTVTANQGGTWTVQPGNTANTTAWKVDGSAVTQPVSGTVGLTAGQAVELLDSGGANKASISAAGAVKVDNSAVTQPVSGTVTSNQGTANATPWNENIAQVGGVAVVAQAKGAQATNFVPVSQPKDTGRTYTVFTIDRVAGVASEALATMSINKAGTVTSSTSYTVTTGKILRLTTLVVTILDSTTTTVNGRVRVRSAATVTATSGIVIASDVGNFPGTAAAGLGAGEEIAIPDGVEIAAGQQIGISQILSSTSSTLSVCLIGYEY